MNGTGFIVVTVNGQVEGINIDHIVRITSARSIHLADGTAVTVSESRNELLEAIKAGRGLPPTA